MEPADPSTSLGGFATIVVEGCGIEAEKMYWLECPLTTDIARGHYIYMLFSESAHETRDICRASAHRALHAACRASDRVNLNSMASHPGNRKTCNVQVE